MRRLLVFSATIVLVLAFSAVTGGADDMVTVTPDSPAHLEGLKVTVDPDIGDVEVTNAIFISNPGEDGIVEVRQTSGAIVNVALNVKDVDGIRIIEIVPPNDGGDICEVGPNCD